MFRKLGFVHRRLWRDDVLYRVCVLLGPAPMVGIGFALALWYAMPTPRGTAPLPPPGWAVPNRGPNWSAEATTPSALQPGGPLPPSGVNGIPSGMRTGWEGAILPVVVGNALDPNVLAKPLRGFALEQTELDMDHVLAEGPMEGTFVGSGTAALVIRVAGTYALTARLERPAGPAADCVVRLAFGQRRVISSYNVNMVNAVTRTYPSVGFTLAPGLYRIAVALGCWHDGREVGPARLTVLLTHPNEVTAVPLRPDELVSPEQRTGD